MSVRNISLLLAALLITAGTGLVAKTWIDAQKPQVVAQAPMAPKVLGAQVLVAASDIPIGTLIQDTHLRWQIWPTDALPDTYVIKPQAPDAADPTQDLITAGAVARENISAGEPITKGRYLMPGDRGFLAAVLRPGYRAMAVSINATSGISGLVFPGDRVDILLTHTVQRGGINRRASETVLSNVRVLAIDQAISTPDGQARLGKNTTLEVTPKQAEILTVLSELGKLSLSLRSLVKDEEELNQLANSEDPMEEPDPERGTTYTWDTEVSRLISVPSSARQDVVKVSRGNATEEMKFPKGK